MRWYGSYYSPVEVLAVTRNLRQKGECVRVVRVPYKGDRYWDVFIKNKG